MLKKFFGADRPGLRSLTSKVLDFRFFKCAGVYRPQFQAIEMKLFRRIALLVE